MELQEKHIEALLAAGVDPQQIKAAQELLDVMRRQTDADRAKAYRERKKTLAKH